MIRLGDSAFLVGDRPTFFFGGELHYFRVEREAWGDRVRQAKRLGMNTLSSYVPWIWHEPEEGSFDFAGTTHPQRDLQGFLDLVDSEGLWFVPRIGPVSNAELTLEGLPTWLFERYPDTQLLREDGTSMVGMPSYRHPAFLEAVGRWYRALLPTLSPRTMARGGSIPYVQLCNEIDMPTWLSKQGDHHAHVRRLWIEFSGEHADARQPDGAVTSWPSPRHTRWMEFQARYFADYVRELSARAAELEVPFLVNVAQWTDHHDRGRGIDAPLTTTMFRDVALAAPDLLVGGDYYPRRIDYDNFHDVVIATEVVRMVSRPGAPLVCPELQAGGNEDRPRVYASDLSLLLHVSAGHGLNALNAYMLAGGQNPPGLGVFGVEHDWQAPIGPAGDLRPNAEALRGFAEFLASAPGFAGTRKRFDTHFGFYAPYFQTEYLRGAEISALEHRRVQVAQDGFLRLLTLANIQYDFVDLARTGDFARLGSLLVYSEDWMDSAMQGRLAEFARGGGRLLLFPTVPTRGADGEPCTLLADAIGARPIQARTRFVHTGGTSLPVPAVSTFESSSSDRVLGTTDDGATCMLSRRVGDGLALVVGFGMRHRFDRQVRLARAWCKELGVEPHLCLEPHDVVGVTRDDGRELYLTLLNFHEEPRTVRGSVDWKGRAVDLGTIELPARSARAVLAASGP